MVQSTLERIMKLKGRNCVSILLKTHRTHPENEQDEIRLKNLIRKAEEQLRGALPGEEATLIIQQLEKVAAKIDHRYNLEGLAVFANSDFAEMVRLPIEVVDRVVVDDTFATRDLVRAMQTIDSFYLLRLSLESAHLYGVYAGRISEEFIAAGFPVRNDQYTTDSLKASFGPVQDNYLREYVNRVDKSMLTIYRDLPKPIVIVGTDSVVSFLKKEADKLSVYTGQITPTGEKESMMQLAQRALEALQPYWKEQKELARKELAEAMSANLLETSPTTIWRSIEEGRGEVLFVERDYFQPAVKGAGEIRLMEAKTSPKAENDIVDEMIEGVLAKKGRVVFMDNDTVDTLKGVALKLRY
jgi:hypothetical protein